MIDLPPFTSSGEDNAVFYSLAYCVGVYGRGTPPPPACLILDFCSSPAFCRFSIQARSPDGHIYHYHRGDDALDTLEYALIFASTDYRVPASYWRLFPMPDDAACGWAARPADRDAYFADRTHLCRILYRLRIFNRPDRKPLFRLDGSVPGFADSGPDTQEIVTTEIKAVAEASSR